MAVQEFLCRPSSSRACKRIRLPPRPSRANDFVCPLRRISEVSSGRHFAVAVQRSGLRTPLVLGKRHTIRYRNELPFRNQGFFNIPFCKQGFFKIRQTDINLSNSLALPRLYDIVRGGGAQRARPANHFCSNCPSAGSTSAIGMRVFCLALLWMM
jgi:hypothetical protein